MKYQPISNYPSFDLPPISQNILNELMREHGRHPAKIMPPVDFGVKIQRDKPLHEAELSTREILDMFDYQDALRYVYIPHFMTQAIMYYMEMLMKYCVDNKLSEFKKHKRIMQAMQDEYIEALKHEMPEKVFNKFLTQREEFLESCYSNLQIAYFTFSNEISKKYGHLKHELPYCYAAIIYELVKYVEEHDKMVNRTIADKTHKPVRDYADERLLIIKKVCSEIIKPYKIDETELTQRAVKVIANKAIFMINEMCNSN